MGRAISLSLSPFEKQPTSFSSPFSISSNVPPALLRKENNPKKKKQRGTHIQVKKQGTRLLAHNFKLGSFVLGFFYVHGPSSPAETDATSVSFVARTYIHSRQSGNWKACVGGRPVGVVYLWY